MKNFDASRDGAFPLHCFACEGEIPNGIWFARIPIGGSRVAFCRPRCLEAFLAHREEMTARLPVEFTGFCNASPRNAKELPSQGERAFHGILNWTCENQSSAQV